MFYFTQYAEKKFEILNRHKIFFTREQIQDVLTAPEKTKKNGKFLICHKDGLGVVCRKENEILKVLTFYPIK